MAETATREDHVRFWRFLAGRLKEHGNIMWALNESIEEMAGTAFGEPVNRVAETVESGKPLWQTVSAESGLFSQTAVMLLRAGEEGGHMTEVAERIAEAAKDGSLPLPGVPAEGEEQVRYWRCFGRMIGSGVPILESLRVLREEVCGEALAEATRAIEQSVLRGSSMANAMREHPDLFPLAVCFVVEIGEDSGDLHERAMQIADALESGDLGALRAEPIESLPLMDELPAVRRFVNILILNALQQKASDVHVEPTENRRGRYRLRLDGVLHDYDRPREGLHNGEEVPYDEVVNRIKVMAGMDLAEKRLPQDGRIQLNVSGEPVDLRVCALPTVHGERITMRVLRREHARVTLGELGMLEDDLERIRSLRRLRHGTVLLAGPTGCGKTTLLYAMLLELDRDRQCVVSVEDPVEYYLEGVSQVGVNPQVGRTFATVVRSVLRQDPDVILIGELRDSEVVNLTAQCALTGHLVLTTIHAATAPGGIKRLLDMDLAPFLVNASLSAVVSQRLVRILCKDCKQPVEPPLHSLPPEAAALIEGRDDVQFYRPVGCEKCLHTGYRGRTCIHEILVPDDRVRELVAAEASVREIREAAVAGGMRTMLACGIEQAARGTTSVQEVLRVAPTGPND